MHVMQLRVEQDPLTGRDISKSCWNGHHQKGIGSFDRAWNDDCCHEEMCNCLCHERMLDGEADVSVKAQ